MQQVNIRFISLAIVPAIYDTCNERTIRYLAANITLVDLTLNYRLLTSLVETCIDIVMQVQTGSKETEWMTHGHPTRIHNIQGYDTNTVVTTWRILTCSCLLNLPKDRPVHSEIFLKLRR